MLNPTIWKLFTLPLSDGAAETAPGDLRLLAAVGDEARNDYLRGLGAIGNIIFWACENENYTDQQSDMRALGAFLKHTTDMALAADFFAGYVEALADDVEFDANESATASLPEKGVGSEFDVYSEILNGGKRA
ncbi:hypothetical protein [Klebsiella michiganensis]|uniref:hypothetical protein n=1 Tax=Klebsiella michiganensis TaxID=1134687 RepID=UPI002180B1B9|nr:hypothetical protein [Klebsiella michiganensis]